MTIIGQRYELSTLLGRGGMGEVWLGKNVTVGNSVAVKLLRPPAEDGGDYQDRFLAEARIGVSLRHPGIAQVLDAGREPDGRLYIVFELVEGEDLRKLVSRHGRLSWRTARDIVARVGEALAYAHERGVVHRDVKPENVRVQVDLVGVHVKVLDFGIARFAGDARLTAKGAFAGTPAYMAPEQTEEVEIDGRADQYCLGLILFELVTGQRVVAEKSATSALVAQLTRPLPTLTSVSPDRAFPALEALLQRACSKDRSQRFPTMPNFLAELLSLPDPSWVEPSPRATDLAVPVPERTSPADNQPTRPSLRPVRAVDDRVTPAPPSAEPPTERDLAEPALSPTVRSQPGLEALQVTVRSQPALTAPAAQSTAPQPQARRSSPWVAFAAVFAVVSVAVAAGVAWRAQPVEPSVPQPPSRMPVGSAIPLAPLAELDAGVAVVAPAVPDAGSSTAQIPAEGLDAGARVVKRPPQVPREPPAIARPPAEETKRPPESPPSDVPTGLCPQLAQFAPEFHSLSKAELLARYRSTPYVVPSGIERTVTMLETMAESYAPATRECQHRASLVAQIIAAKTLPGLLPNPWALTRSVAQLETVYRKANLVKPRTAEAREAILGFVHRDTTSPDPGDVPYLLRMSLGELLACELTDAELATLGAKRGAVCRYP